MKALQLPDDGFPAQPRPGVCWLYTYYFQGEEVAFVKSRFTSYESLSQSQRQTLIELLPDKRQSRLIELMLAFDFPGPFQSHFDKVLDACQDSPISIITSLDSALNAGTPGPHASALQTALLREVLATIALASGNFPLVTSLVTSGPPPPREQTCHVWGFRECVWPVPFTVVTALVRHRWLRPHPTHARDVVSTISGHPGVEAAIERFDALRAVGYLPSFEGGPDPTQAERERSIFFLYAVQYGPLPVLRHVVQTMPVLEFGSPHAQKLVLSVADKPERAEVLRWLVDEQGLDVDATGWFTEFGEHDENTTCYQQTALHAAVMSGNDENVRVLLDRGAKVRRDGAGRTPLARAVKYEKVLVVQFLEQWLAERGRPMDWVDD